MGANAGAIQAGAAYVELFLKDNRFTSGLKSAGKSLQSWGASIAKMGAAITAGAATIVGPLTMAAAKLAEMTAPISGMAKRTGMATDAVQELGWAAKMGGTDIETLEGGVRKMQKAIVEAAGGSKQQADAFDALGLSAAELQRLSPDKQFAAIADKIAMIDDPAKKTTLAMAIFGKTGTALIPMLNQGSAGLAAAGQQARDYGIILGGPALQAASDFRKANKILGAVTEATWANVGAAFAPVLTKMASEMTNILVAVNRWVQDNQPLITTIGTVAKYVGLAGIAIGVLGGVVAGVGTVFGMVASAIAGVGTVIGVVGSVIGAILSPIGLVAVAVAGLAAYFVYASGTGAAAFGWLSDVIGELVTDFKATFKGISDAITAGDLSLAAKILWATLKMEWAKGTAALNEVWIGAKLIFKTTWAEAFYWIAETWIKATSWMESAWVNFANAVATNWKKAESTVATGVAWIIAKIDGLDPEQVINTLQEDYARAQKSRDATAAGRTAGIASDKAGALANLQSDKQKELQANQDAAAAALSGGPGELERLKAERQALLDEAAAKADAAKKKEGPAKPEMPTMPELNQMGAAMKGPQGTFSGAAAAMMGWTGQTHGERIARATERTAVACEELTDEEMLWGE